MAEILEQLFTKNLWSWWLNVYSKKTYGRAEFYCLGGVRNMLLRMDPELKLPHSANGDYKGDSAYSCGRALAKNPNKWGWKKIPENELKEWKYVLCFWDIPPGKHGHIAIIQVETMKTFGDIYRPFSHYKNKKQPIIGYFVPLQDYEDYLKGKRIQAQIGGGAFYDLLPSTPLPRLKS